jgi:hypothetical protein
MMRLVRVMKFVKLRESEAAFVINAVKNYPRLENHCGDLSLVQQMLRFAQA